MTSRLQVSRIITATLLTAIFWSFQVKPVPAFREQYNCILTKTKTVIVDTSAKTTSQTFVNVPNSYVTIVQSAPGCVVVQFTASAFIAGSSPMTVQAFIDDLPSNFTSPTWYWAPNAIYQTDHTVTGVFPNVAAGTHTIRMKFASNGSNEVFINQRILIVQYR